MNKNVFIIGSGFSSLSASCYLAKAGYKVTVIEKKQFTWWKSKTIQKRWIYI
jgi:phytoene desaturase